MHSATGDIIAPLLLYVTACGATQYAHRRTIYTYPVSGYSYGDIHHRFEWWGTGQPPVEDHALLKILFLEKPAAAAVRLLR